MNFNVSQEQLIMQRKLADSPELLFEFKKLVEIHGGKNWPQIARVLKQTFNYEVKYPYRLKQIWLAMTERQEEPNNEEWTHLLQIFVQQKGDIYQGITEFAKYSERQLSKEKFKTLQDQGLKQGLKTFIMILSRKKKGHLHNQARHSYKSILLMLKTIDLKSEDPQFLEVQANALKLQQLYICYSNHFAKDRTTVFSHLRTIVTRYQMEQILCSLFLVHELKLIYLRHYERDEDLISHPYLAKTIESNKETEIYKKLIHERDWEQKYQMFHSINIDDDAYKLYLNSIQPKGKSSIDGGGTFKVGVTNFSTKWSVWQRNQDKPKLKTVRGKIRQPGETVYRGWKTVVFDQNNGQSSAPPSEDEPDEEQLLYKRRKMQKLYQQAFGDGDDVKRKKNKSKHQEQEY